MHIFLRDSICIQKRLILYVLICITLWETTDILKQGCLRSVAELKWMDTKKASLLEGDQLGDHLSIAEREV